MFGWNKGDDSSCKPSFLIVDDDPNIVELIEKYLTDHYECDLEIAKDGHRGLYWIENKSFDLITLDIKMGQINGDVVYRQIRETPKNKTTPIIIISGYIDEDVRNLIADDNLSVVVTKPFSSKNFYSVIDQFLSPSQETG